MLERAQKGLFMKNAKNYLAHYEHWQNVNAEELWRLWKNVLKCINLIAYLFHAMVKLAIGFLLNANYLVKYHELGKLPEEIHGSFSLNQNWYRN